jgi:hypothetical protein
VNQVGLVLRREVLRGTTGPVHVTVERADAVARIHHQLLTKLKEPAHSTWATITDAEFIIRAENMTLIYRLTAYEPRGGYWRLELQRCVNERTCPTAV